MRHEHTAEVMIYVVMIYEVMIYEVMIYEVMIYEVMIYARAGCFTRMRYEKLTQLPLQVLSGWRLFLPMCGEHCFVELLQSCECPNLQHKL
jgi:hypothetical protein